MGRSPTGRTTPEPQPGCSPASSASGPYREAIKLGMSRGRNAIAIWQDLVDKSQLHRWLSKHQAVRKQAPRIRERTISWRDWNPKLRSVDAGGQGRFIEFSKRMIPQDGRGDAVISRSPVCSPCSSPPTASPRWRWPLSAGGGSCRGIGGAPDAGRDGLTESNEPQANPPKRVQSIDRSRSKTSTIHIFGAARR
jgi:hypothetical protein